MSQPHRVIVSSRAAFYFPSYFYVLSSYFLLLMSYLKDLDYSVMQQCIHCGMCLPTCPTYMETKIERNSPRGRIALMRAIADSQLEAEKAFADEMYFCLGCLACETACPAGVDYTQLFEMARAEAERSPAEQTPLRKLMRWL